MGQKMFRFAQLGAARSRQDESIEVGEVGSKRPSLGGNGGHFAWWGGLICALLPPPWLLVYLLVHSRQAHKPVPTRYVPV
jgi:hypothetical protein